MTERVSEMAVYNDIMDSLNELLDHATGKETAVIEHRMSIADVKDFSPQEIKRIRQEAKMTQKLFAACLGVSAKSVEAWEGGRSRPDGAARRLIGLIEKDSLFAEKVGILVMQ